MLMKYNLYIVPVLGLISGLLAGMLSATVMKAHNGDEFLPGLLFGILIGLYYLLIKNRHSWLSLFGFMIASTVAYFVAYALAFFTYQSWNLFSFFLAGTMGAYLLALSFSLCIKKLRSSGMLLIALIGGAWAFVWIALALFFLPLDIGGAWSLGRMDDLQVFQANRGWVTLFASWQMLLGFSLAWFSRKTVS